MHPRTHAGLLLILTLLLLGVMLRPAHAEPSPGELTPRLQEIYDLRSRWILTGDAPPPVETDYLPDSKAAARALHHEHGKFRYMRTWAQNRGVRIVEAKATIRPQLLKRTPTMARFRVAQTLQLGYIYPGEETVNRSGYGTRHIVELQSKDGKWLIAMESYTDPLGDDTEVPDVTPALAPEPLPAHPKLPAYGVNAAAGASGYDRAGAVSYADKFCGLAWGCGNNNQYNPSFRDYNGVGGDCSNFISQALREGGKLRIPIMTRVDSLASHLRSAGRAQLVAKNTFQPLWQQARKESTGFRSLLKEGDVITYQEKGKLEHSAIITGFDSRGYPLINSHTADRYRVPFDLGWDRKTVYWLFGVRD